MEKEELKSEAYETVGEKRIKEICLEYNLSEDDQELVLKILAEWDKIYAEEKNAFVRNHLKVIRAATLIAGKPNSSDISVAVARIALEFRHLKISPSNATN